MVTFAVTLKKGGVGKTTVSSNLAQVLGVCGKKVLVVDNDEQHNLTKSMGLKVQKIDIADLYSGNVDVDKFMNNGIYETMIDGVHCIPSSNKLTKISVKGNRLKELLERREINEYYDFCIIDCPPGVKNKENECAIQAANLFILPVEMKQFCIDGMVEMINVLTSEYGRDMSEIIIIPNMIREVKKHLDIIATLRNAYPENVTSIYIPYDEVLDNVITEKKSLVISRSSAKATAYFIKLMFEVFGLDETTVWDTIKAKRKSERSETGKKNLIRYRIQQEMGKQANLNQEVLVNE